MGGQIESDFVVKPRRSRDYRGVNPSEQLAMIGAGFDLVSGGDLVAIRLDGIDNADELDAVDARRQAGVRSSQMSNADHS
jgi:hypothetical protein